METAYGSTATLSPEVERAISAYRHKVFVEKLGWDLTSQDGEERDQFDLPETLYVAVRDEQGEICGCARLLPTTSPYLLSEVFPQLLGGQAVPHAPDIWELSRFAAVDLRAPKNLKSQAADAEIRRKLLAAAIACAAEQGAKRLITVSPLGIERLLLRMGVHAHRAGSPMMIDGHLIFACWIEIDEQTQKALDLRQESLKEMVNAGFQKIPS